MLIEICVRGLGPDGPALAKKIYHHLIEGVGDDDQSFEFKERVELQSWAPPENWADSLLKGPVDASGICISVNSYFDWNEKDRSDFPTRVESFVAQTRCAHPFTHPVGIPASVLVLACIFHRSPLPPEFWRNGLFEPPTKSNSSSPSLQKIPKLKRKKRSKSSE